MSARRVDIWVGLAFLLLAVLALTLWIPLDIESGIIEKVRRREKMGDALFPTSIAVAMVIVAAVHLLVSLRAREGAKSESAFGHLAYLASLIAIIALALLLMRYAGPAVVAMVAESGTYRELRDTVPYKYVGFVSGGLVLVVGLIALVQGKVSLRAVSVGLAAVLALILLYDVPFDDLLLPPNGDV